MDTPQLDTLTDYYAKTNSTMFPLVEKLGYYNIGYGLLYSLIIDEQEDNYEEEDTKTTVANQRDYKEKARIHHINWLKINYGDGFIPAQYKPEGDLISEYGNDLETVLSEWDQSNPIYWYKGKHLFVVPAPSSSQAGADRLKVSMELLPADLTNGDTPDLPSNFHYLLAVYAALQYHKNNLETDAALIREKDWKEGIAEMLATMFPKARERELLVHIPDDDGSNY